MNAFNAQIFTIAALARVVEEKATLVTFTNGEVVVVTTMPSLTAREDTTVQVTTVEESDEIVLDPKSTRSM